MSFRASPETNDTKFAATMSVPRMMQTPCEAQGRNGYGAWQKIIKKGGKLVSIVPAKKKTAKLLQQLGGAPRFGKRRLHLQTV